VDTIDEAVLPERRRRRSYSAQFKARVIQACQAPGVSLASVALANGMNANLLRRWVNDRERAQSLQTVMAQRLVDRAAPQFVSVGVNKPDSDPIRIEIRKGGVSITMSLPAALVGESGKVLRELLK
jgi:hypothetical protein